MGAAALLGLGASASGIESANIVGYTTTNVAVNAWIILGAQFVTTSNTNMKISEFLKGTMTGVTCDDEGSFDEANASKIEVWDATSGKYTFYYYLSNPLVSDGAGNYSNSSTPGWADGYGVKTSDTISPGMGFWFKPTTAVTVLITK